MLSPLSEKTTTIYVVTALCFPFFNFFFHLQDAESNLIISEKRNHNQVITMFLNKWKMVRIFYFLKKYFCGLHTWWYYSSNELLLIKINFRPYLNKHTYDILIPFFFFSNFFICFVAGRRLDTFRNKLGLNEHI